MTKGGAVPGYQMHKDDVQRRLRRVEGQVRGIQRLVEEDTYCIDVLTQIAAVNRALQGVAVGLLHDHLGHCVSDAVRAGEAEGTAKVTEATAAIERLLKA
jgi:DNA-binding FrmR family transcriptional regulator